MDLGHWFQAHSPCIKSMWCLRLCRLLRSVSKHRMFGLDLNPDNVVLDVEETSSIIRDMKLIDFGGGSWWDHVAQFSSVALYASMLIAFNASLITRFTHIYESRPLDSHLRRLLRSRHVAYEVYNVLLNQHVSRIWANLFPGVDCISLMDDLRCADNTS